MTNNISKDRIYWIDNLRTFAVFLVVIYHVGGVYESAGLWSSFWLVDDPNTFILSGIINIILDFTAIPLLFFVSGYLVPLSFSMKNTEDFLKNKFKRLMIPWLVAVVTLIPIYKFIFLFSRGLPQENWTTYFHLSSNNISSQNWLWFLPVLFLFSILYIVFDKYKSKFTQKSIGILITGMVITGFISSIIAGNIYGYRSWLHTWILDFENEKILMYFLIFIIGAICREKNIFSSKPESKTLYNIASYTAWLPVNLHVFARLAPFFILGIEKTSWYIPVWWVTFYISMLSVVFLVIQIFWRYFDKAGGLWNILSRNSYGVYITHVIVIGILGTILLKISIPGYLKYLILTFTSYFFSNVIVEIWRKVLG